MGPFDTYVLTPEGIADIKRVKGVMTYALSLVTPHLPPCRETSLFITKMEEGMFYATKALSSKKENHKGTLKFGVEPNEFGDKNVTE
jgi:hypothetical protein